jgi:hypothetical protein
LGLDLALPLLPSPPLASIIADMAKSRDKGKKEVKKPKKKK